MGQVAMGWFIFEGGIQKAAPFPWIAHEWFQVPQGECEQMKTTKGNSVGRAEKCLGPTVWKQSVVW